MAFRDYILNNIGWKLLSLFLAALTWLTIESDFKNDEKLRESPVVMGPNTRSFSAVPVTLLTSPAGNGKFVVTPQTVAIEISGRLDELKELQVQDIKAFVDVSDADDETMFRRTIHIQAPKDFKAIALPAVASVERISNAKEQ